MKSASRQMFNLLYWIAVGLAAYASFGWLKREVHPQVMELVGPFATVLYIVVTLAALFLLNYLNEAICSTFNAAKQRMTGDSPVHYDGGDYGAKVARTARKLEKRGDFLGAGEAYESVEMWIQAADMLERAGQLSRAAQMHEKAQNPQRAMSLYELDGNYPAAAERALDEGLRDKAHELYRKAGETAEETNRFPAAADFYESANDFGRAARVYESLKRMGDALRCHERAGNSRRIEELVSKIDALALVTKGDVTLDMLNRAAELLARNGKPKKAGELLESAEDYVRAAEFYEKAKEWELAAETYLKADMPEKGEACYAKVDDPFRRADYLARVAIGRGDWQEAGRQFAEADKLTQAVDAYKRGRDFLAAAKIYERMKRYLLAAEMYALAKEMRLAGEAYSKGHDWRNAAECFEACGEHPQAVQAYVSAGDYYRAGKTAQRIGDNPKAIEYLQRVPPTSAEYRSATGFLACAFLALHRVDMARELFQKVIDQITPATENLPVFYGYAKLLEADNPADSLAMYRRILAISMTYEDVEERIKVLEPLAAAGAGSSSSFGTPFPREGRRSPPGDGSVLNGTPALETTRFTAATDAVASAMRRPVTQAPETSFGNEDRYQIIQELGRGGMAIVYKARDRHLEREVALKTFPLAREGSASQEETFLREARLIARLSHPNIVTIYDSGHMEDLYYIAMEYVQGEDLKVQVKRKGPLSLEEVRQIMRQLCSALDYAHSEQVLHRDIKPGNIILRPTGDIKVVDFGLAKILSDAQARQPDPDDDSQRTLIGTPQYMAPEQILANPVDARTDIYSLGLTLFYLLTGRTPFDVKKVSDPLEVSRMQVHAAFPRPSTLRATLPRKVDEVFMKCTQKAPEERYQTVMEFVDDFQKI
jgi:tetratricopeptide (TPR) repeat protein